MSKSLWHCTVDEARVRPDHLDDVVHPHPPHLGLGVVVDGVVWAGVVAAAAPEVDQPAAAVVQQQLLRHGEVESGLREVDERVLVKKDAGGAVPGLKTQIWHNIGLQAPISMR